ncbi:MAG: phosphoenolpyruvate--protein phosphotransferase [Planctomycetaceae bacterium]|jgi:phosphotransferase system enzyme I (PtsI)|nr:phosphoenolpyruvate--protein phosphotransferase [Planctomycetaceae bacterium]
MKTVSGIPVFNGDAIGNAHGIVIGKVFVQESERLGVTERTIPSDKIESEIERYQTAVKNAKDEIESNRDATLESLGQNLADIFEAQILILQDPRLLRETENLIRTKSLAAESAVAITHNAQIEILRKLNNSYIAEKINDIRDIEKRVLRRLLGTRSESLRKLTEPVILLASNLTPSETANLDRNFVKAVVTETGGIGGHTAILAAALEIPCVVGCGNFLANVKNEDVVIVDAISGLLILSPDEKTIQKYQKIIDSGSSRIENLDELRDLEAITADGTKIEILANIEFPQEADNATQRGAEGIGLFRTEFLYLTQESDPTENEHFESYMRVAKAMDGKPVIIRTFDFGDDKESDRHGELIPERNPALGLRGIRLALKRWQLFRTQIRAILRASVHGNIKIMFPLVSTVKEFRQARFSAVKEFMDELEHDGIAYNNNIKIGMMVEVPAAVVMLDHFAEIADFFSIGTNDLTQYVMASDRGNRSVSHLFSSSDPAVLRMIHSAVTVANKTQKPISLCGQLGGAPMRLAILLGLGLRSISCTPSSIPRIKQICRRIMISDCTRIAEKALQFSNAADVQDYAIREMINLIPDLVDKVL